RRERNPGKRVPSTEEEDDEHSRTDGHVGVLVDEEERPLELAVFGVEATHEVRLGLRHVEGLAIGLREERDAEDECRYRHEEDVPHAAPEAGLALRLHDVEEAERALGAGSVHPQEHRQHRQRHREFVRDELRRRTDASKKWILRIRRPAGEDERVYAKGTDREYGEDADVDVGE